MIDQLMMMMGEIVILSVREGQQRVCVRSDHPPPVSLRTPTKNVVQEQDRPRVRHDMAQLVRRGTRARPDGHSHESSRRHSFNCNPVQVYTNGGTREPRQPRKLGCTFPMTRIVTRMGVRTLGVTRTTLCALRPLVSRSLYVEQWLDRPRPRTG
jgi:hypothetical protein